MRGLQSDAALNVPPGKNDVPYPSKLELVRSILMNAAEVAAGTVTGTGAPIPVTLPFDPGIVWAIKPVGAGAPIQCLKHPGFAADTSLQTIAPGANAIVPATIALGADGTKMFTIGADPGINEAGMAIRWFAVGFRNYAGFQ